MKSCTYETLYVQRVCVREYEQVVHVSVCGYRCYVATGISHTELLGRWIQYEYTL